MPAYNEEGNIANTVKEAFSLKLSSDVLVIDDGSVDKTAKMAEDAGANVVSLPFNLGIGAAVQTGFKYARNHEFDLVVRIDGDGQHDISYLEKIIDFLLKEELDIAIGSRFVGSLSNYRFSFVRRIGINFFSSLISLLTDYKVTDPTSGFRAYNKRMIKIFAEYYPHDFPEPEEILVADRYMAKIKETAVKMNKRVSGTSSIRYLKTLYYMIKVTFAILLDKFKRKGDDL
ncbi:MAG: glycosyltransferase family 2 protein [Candidatus Zapsychrus exili]|nr:glycosyltransferase family 2 protein [Candidatus Zapsychrus exili]